jgi:hypothetical protein
MLSGHCPEMLRSQDKSPKRHVFLLNSQNPADSVCLLMTLGMARHDIAVYKH